MIQFQRLMDVIRLNETSNIKFRMDMVHIENECGTAGCLIGTYNYYTNRQPNCFGVSDKDWEYFGITRAEYMWLFNEHPNWDWTLIGLCKKTDIKVRHLASCFKEEALSRLRKFIYYKLHKQEMIVDEKYGIKESARHTEGNHNVLNKVCEQIGVLV